ncbi:hypothetical protein GIB67_029503 [Kingdonia uniflora]|uniref:Calcineurin-like phosphoesterase domain-containing protein n=1 Tax=Kingdonia uniflora TaxID=39325 RepID=A0A7J7NY26_9MAGN|nr:hypothetical protein GIB67_029503 [Kingdonia uniflora]
MVGDLGQTGWTDSTLRHIKGSNYDVMLLPGDLSYADMNQPFWDTFGSLVEPLGSTRPWMVTEGNREIEKIPVIHLESFTAYNARWHMLFKESYKWLEADLAKANRKKTPWLVALVLAPCYNTNSAHQGEDESVEMRKSMKGLLYKAQGDIVFTGHVHTYERFFVTQLKKVKDLLDFRFKSAVYTEDPYDFSKEFNIGDLYRDRIELKNHIRANAVVNKFNLEHVLSNEYKIVIRSRLHKSCRELE